MSLPHGDSALNSKGNMWNTWVVPTLFSIYQSSLTVVCSALSRHNAKDDAKNLVLICWCLINVRLIVFLSQSLSFMIYGSSRRGLSITGNVFSVRSGYEYKVVFFCSLEGRKEILFLVYRGVCPCSLLMPFYFPDNDASWQINSYGKKLDIKKLWAGTIVSIIKRVIFQPLLCFLYWKW